MEPNFVVTLPFALNTLAATLFQLVFLMFILVFTIYTCFLGYHWFSYGTSKAKSMQALAVYLLVSSPGIVIMALTLRYI